jgi:hypothetical protein
MRLSYCHVTILAESCRSIETELYNEQVGKVKGMKIGGAKLLRVEMFFLCMCPSTHLRVLFLLL